MSPEKNLSRLPDKEQPKVPARFIDVTFEVKKDGRSYSSVCPETEITSHGDTIEEATQNIAIASLMTFAILRERGNEQDFFSKKGLPVQTVELDKKPTRVIRKTRQKGHFRLFIDANKSPTRREVETAVKNLS